MAWPYSTARWQRLRLRKLRDAPECEPCLARGLHVAANTADHVIAIAAGGHAFPSHDGLTSMCARCHSRKTQALDRPDRKPGKGLPRGCDVDGKPLAPFLGGGGNFSRTAKILAPMMPNKPE